MQTTGIDGFLGTRASIMLDVVFLAMFLVVPILAWSIWLVRTRRNYALHKRVQLTLGVVLLAAVVAFEVDMRFLTDWRARAADSPFYDTWVFPCLFIHLAFAVPTAILWGMVIILAWRRFPDPPRPNAHSPFHRRWGMIAAWEMVGTAATGWLFYYLAFVA